MCILQNLKLIEECDLSPFCKLVEDTQSDIEANYDEFNDEDCNNDNTDKNKSNQNIKETFDLQNIEKSSNQRNENSNNNSRIVDFLNKELEYEIYYDDEVRFEKKNSNGIWTDIVSTI